MTKTKLREEYDHRLHRTSTKDKSIVLTTANPIVFSDKLRRKVDKYRREG
jgi:hypothetical protein